MIGIRPLRSRSAPAARAAPAQILSDPATPVAAKVEAGLALFPRGPSYQEWAGTLYPLLAEVAPVVQAQLQKKLLKRSVAAASPEARADRERELALAYRQQRGLARFPGQRSTYGAKARALYLGLEARGEALSSGQHAFCSVIDRERDSNPFDLTPGLDRALIALEVALRGPGEGRAPRAQDVETALQTLLESAHGLFGRSADGTQARRVFKALAAVPESAILSITAARGPELSRLHVGRLAALVDEFGAGLRRLPAEERHQAAHHFVLFMRTPAFDALGRDMQAMIKGALEQLSRTSGRLGERVALGIPCAEPFIEYGAPPTLRGRIAAQIFGQVAPGVPALQDGHPAGGEFGR